MTPDRIHVRWGKAGDTRVTYMEERFMPPDNGAEYIRADLIPAMIAEAVAKERVNHVAVYAECDRLKHERNRQHVTQLHAVTEAVAAEREAIAMMCIEEEGTGRYFATLIRNRSAKP